MGMKENITETETRLYYTFKMTDACGGLWKAEYQPKNPKTGKPWQAARGITRGYNAWAGSSRDSSWIVTNYERHLGNPPASEVWSKTYTNGISRGFNTEADAIAAIVEEKQRSGK